MGGVFYLAGIGLAGFAGYSGFPWYFILISSAAMAIGYFVVRAPQIQGIVSSDGAIAVPKILLLQVVIYSIITAPVYFIATLFN